MPFRFLYIVLFTTLCSLSAAASTRRCRLLSCAYDSVPDSIIVTTAPDSVIPTATADSLANDSVGGFGIVFEAFDKVISTAPLLEQRLTDSLANEVDDFDKLSKKKKRMFLSRFIDDQFEEWNNIDTTYIMPQLYDYAVMLQTTTSFESFSIRSLGENKQTLRFAPNPTFRLGGYFGWRWLFLGYTFDVGGLLGNKHGNTKKVEWDLSFYTSKLGIDLYWRQTGNDFRCKNLNKLFSSDNPRPDGLSDDFSGLDIMTRGINVYYIFNHRQSPSLIFKYNIYN